jgi:Flp pilus assembly protein TadG
MQARGTRKAAARRLRVGARDERGATMVEFALVLPLLVLLTFGIIEFAVAFNADSTVASATRAGGRTAAILSTDPQMSFKAGQAAATALDISPNTIVGNAVVCVAQYQSTNPDPCTESTSTKMTLVHTGAAGDPVWQVADLNGANPGLYPAADNWPVSQRNYGCPTLSQPQGSFDRVIVHLEIKHKLLVPGMFASFFGGTVAPTLSSSSVFQLEPVPSSTCPPVS